MPLWGDVSQTPYTHTKAPRYYLNRKYLLLLARIVNGQREHARMDLVFNLNGSVTHLDVSIVAAFSCNPSLVSASSTRPGHMAKRAEKGKFDRCPHINLVPFILETTGRPGSHARKFISNLMRDADNPPPSLPKAIRDTWSAIQSVLHSAIPKRTTHSRRYVISGDHCHSQFLLCLLRVDSCQYRPNGNAHSVFSVKPTAAVPCGPTVTTPRLTTTSTTLTPICYSCSLTSTLRQPCLPASLKLMCSTWPLVADSPRVGHFHHFTAPLPLS